MTLAADPSSALDVLAFSPLSDAINAGSATHLFSGGGCPDASLLVGSWLCNSSQTAWEVCLIGPQNVSASCDPNDHTLYPNDSRGYTNNVTLSCSDPFLDQICPAPPPPPPPPPPPVDRYGWTVSSSSVDPCVNTGSFTPGGIITLYLWYAYNTTEGIQAADITATVNPSGTLNFLGFNAANGFSQCRDADGSSPRGWRLS